MADPSDLKTKFTSNGVKELYNFTSNSFNIQKRTKIEGHFISAEIISNDMDKDSSSSKPENDDKNNQGISILPLTGVKGDTLFNNMLSFSYFTGLNGTNWVAGILSDPFGLYINTYTDKMDMVSTKLIHRTDIVEYTDLDLENTDIGVLATVSNMGESWTLDIYVLHPSKVSLSIPMVFKGRGVISKPSLFDVGTVKGKKTILISYLLDGELIVTHFIVRLPKKKVKGESLDLYESKESEEGLDEEFNPELATKMTKNLKTKLAQRVQDYSGYFNRETDTLVLYTIRRPSQQQGEISETFNPVSIVKIEGPLVKF